MLKVPIFIVDNTCKVVFGNQAFAALAGGEKDEFEGAQLESLIHFESDGLKGALSASDNPCLETWAAIKGSKYFFECRPTPIYDSIGNNIGVIWIILDRTSQKMALQTVQNLAARTGAGDLSARADVRAEGDYRLLLESINSMLDILIEPLTLSVEYIDRISRGDIPEKITKNYSGDFNALKNSLNNCIDGINGITIEMDRVVHAASAGVLSVRGDIDMFKGAYRELIQGQNEIIESIAVPLGDLTVQLEKMAVNDLDRHERENYPGVWGGLREAADKVYDTMVNIRETVIRISNGDLSDLDKFKNIGCKSENDTLTPAFIRMLESIMGVIEDVAILAGSITVGDFSKRGDEKKYQGGYREIILGMNGLIDSVTDPLNEFVTMLAQLAINDYTQMMTKNYAGVWGELKNAANITIERIRHTEQEIRESEAKYRTIFETTGTATVIIEDDTTISLANQEFEHLSGYSKRELEGRKSWLDFITSKDIELCQKYHHLRRIKPDAAPRHYETEFVNRRGEHRNVLVIVDIIPGTKKSVESFLDITERKQAEERLRQLSYHDVLTGLYNRSYFEEELLRLDVERQLPLSIIIGDVNGLKLVNDTLGHQKGDELLARAAAILKRNSRNEDIVCRWAGDEFAILLPQTEKETANNICERIRSACQATEGEPVPISFSLGVATKESLATRTLLVIKEAEDAMYRDKLLDSRSTRFSMINFFKRALAEKSAETPEHCQRIVDIVTRIGGVLGLSAKEREELDILAALHDIGQVAIPKELLSKPYYLTEDEWKLIKRHPEIGEGIARLVPDLENVAEAILAHHEYWNGTGYPRGLKGEQIPLLSRILAIADAYDVMTNGRPYKKAISQKAAVEEIKMCAGTQFDPELVRLFVDICCQHEQ
ncbi:MAG: HD domain-containing phosphohydrolase [Thermacetogeniaceae bacterium]